MQRQTAVTAHFSCEQLLLLNFAFQHWRDPQRLLSDMMTWIYEQMTPEQTECLIETTQLKMFQF